MTFKTLLASAVAAAGLLAAGSAGAVTVNWTDWTAASGSHADGTLNLGATSVDVDYDGSIKFVQTNGGTDFWVDFGYTQNLVNRPTGSDIIAITDGGAKTITFSQAVVNPYLAFSSWNNNLVTFSAPFTVISQGQGYWGSGSFGVSNNNQSFYGNGEVHGVLQFQGTFTQLSFTDTSEDWHGFTVGAESVAGAVPEPAAWALMIGGFGMAGGALRRRKALTA